MKWTVIRPLHQQDEGRDAGASLPLVGRGKGWGSLRTAKHREIAPIELRRDSTATLKPAPQGGGGHQRRTSRSKGYRPSGAPETAIAQVAAPSATRGPRSRASDPAAASAEASETD